MIAADSHDDGIVRHAGNLGDGSQHRQAQDQAALQGRVIIQKANGPNCRCFLAGTGQQNIGYHLTKSAGPQDEHIDRMKHGLID
ncbi:MAG TPA: hypothetical protein VEC96_00490 [Anaerolineae bacterium]|nr:hypothetical protein [Anaerolineae bacterium]